MLRILMSWLADRLERGKATTPQRRSENRVSRVAIRGYTDNQSNESLHRKFMTSKFPSTLVLMELAEELSVRLCELNKAKVDKT